MAVYGPIEGKIKEREKFYNDLGRVLDRVGNGYKILVGR